MGGMSWNCADTLLLQIGYGSNKKTRYMMPSGHKAFLVSNSMTILLLNNDSLSYI